MTATITPQDQTQTPNNEPPKQKPGGLPSPVKLILKPLLYASLLFHGVLLFAPLPSNQKLEIPKEEDYQIKVTQIPPAKPSPKLTQPEQQSAAASDAADVGDTSGGGGSGGDDTGSTTTSSFSSLRSDTSASSTRKNYTGSFAAFPNFVPSEVGCYGRPDCRTVKGRSLETVDNYFQQALKANDFGVEPVRTDSNLRVYSLKGGLEQRHLSILADGQDTLYVLSALPVVSVAEVKETGANFTSAATTSPSSSTGDTTTRPTTGGQTTANISGTSTSSEPLVEVPEELFVLLDDLIPALPAPDTLPEEYSDAKPAYFAQPNLFFKLPVATSPGQQQASTQPNVAAADAEPLPGMERAVYILGVAPEKFYTESLEEKLKSLEAGAKRVFLSVEKVGEFAGGALYEMKREKDVPLYLNLLPLQKHPTGKEGTIVVLWSRDPRPPARVTGRPLASPSPVASPSPSQ
jgi:hypothetical protein